MVVWGAIVGFIVGGLVTLITAPKIGSGKRPPIAEATEQVKTRIIPAITTPADPVEDSLSEGREAARRRREDLGVK